MSYRKNVIFGLLCIGIAVITRILSRKYFKNPPTIDIDMPNESDFAIGKFLISSYISLPIIMNCLNMVHCRSSRGYPRNLLKQ